MLFKKIIMKNILKSLAFVFGLLIMLNCSSRNQVFTKDFLMKKGANLDLSTRDQYGANMGCNRIFMKADFKGDGTVAFSGIGSTMMYCQDAMKLEEAFGKALPTMVHYKIEGHFLTLKSKDGSSMKFVAADWD